MSSILCGYVAELEDYGVIKSNKKVFLLERKIFSSNFFWSLPFEK